MLDTRLYANNAKTTLATSVAATDTSIQVANGNLFPNPGPGQYFLATIDTGSSYEVIKVTARSGSVFTNCIRGYENTLASPYQAGTRIENRITAGTAASWTRFQDTMATIASIDALDTPANSNSNSYLTATTDDGGNPILAVENGVTNTWRFLNYPTRITSGTVPVGGATLTSVTLSNAISLLPSPFAGKYILQFVTGANQGLSRAVTSVSGNTITWATALPQTPSTSDGFEVYKSENSSISDLNSSADDSLIFAIILNN